MQPEPGKVLGKGLFRIVYEFGPKLVLKLDRPACHAALVSPSDSRRGRHAGSSNRREWLVWQKIQGTPLQPYFAEVKELREDGSLVMVRATHDCRGLPSGLDARMLELADTLGLYDGADRNIGRFGRRLKFLDYQMIDLRRLPTGVKLAQEWQRRG